MAAVQDLAGTKAVVFGGCGFLGAHVACGLVRAGADTIVFDTSTRHDGVPPAAACEEADALDATAVRHALVGADRVFAFAAGGGAQASLQDPLADLAASCQTQLVLLEAVREICPEATVVFPGSRLEYGRPRRLPVDESQPLIGDSPYAINKSACAAYYRAYAEVYGLRTVVLRLSNPYGPHPLQQAYKGFGILNHFLDQAMLGRPIRLYGGGSQLRDFVFIDDVIDAVLQASGRPDLAGAVMNIGAGQGMSLARAAAEVVDVVGGGSVEHVPWPPDASLVETGDFYFDVSRARELLGWVPRTPLRAGLEATLAGRLGTGGSPASV